MSNTYHRTVNEYNSLNNDLIAFDDKHPDIAGTINGVSNLLNIGLAFFDEGSTAEVAAAGVGETLAGAGRQLGGYVRDVFAKGKSLMFRNAEGEEGVSIKASSPSEIAWGYGKLSPRQAKLLEDLPKPGRFAEIYKSDVNPTDLAALTAHTGDEFGMFTLGSRRIVLRGADSQLRIEGELFDKLQSQGWRWSMHTHPGVVDRVLMSSGADREALNVFNQSRSMILNSAGRRSIFDIGNDYAVTNVMEREVEFGLRY